MLLGSHHVLIARTEYLEYLGDALRTISHGTDGLYAANLVYLAHAGNAGGNEDGRIDLALLVRWRAQHYLLAAGNPGRSRQHQNGREEWGSAAGNVETYTLDGHALLPAGDTLLGLHLLTDKAL